MHESLQRTVAFIKFKSYSLGRSTGTSRPGIVKSQIKFVLDTVVSDAQAPLLYGARSKIRGLVTNLKASKLASLFGLNAYNKRACMEANVT